MSGNHVTKKHKFVDPIFRGLFKYTYLCCLTVVDIEFYSRVLVEPSG